MSNYTEISSPFSSVENGLVEMGIEIHKDRFSTHVVDLCVAVFVGVAMGALCTYLWLQDTRAIRFELNSNNSLQTEQQVQPPQEATYISI